VDIKGLKSLIHSKTTEAEALLEGDAPDMDKVAELTAEAEGYQKRLDAMIKVQTLKAASEPEPETKHTTPLVVTTDEADNALKANPYKSLGAFLMDVQAAGLGQTVADRLRPLRSGDALDEGGFSLNKALGDDFVGGLTKSAFAKQTGLHEGLGATGGFLVGTDQGGSLMQRVYDVGNILQRVDMTGISAGSNGMTFYGVNETSRANGSRRGGIRAYWAAEGGVKTASQPAFRKLELRLHKVIGLVYATDELLQDANALESWIMANLPEELAFVTEDAIINGTGVGMPQGIRASGALVTQPAEAGQAADTIVSQNIMNMWSRLWAPSRRDAVWLISQDIEPQLYQLNLGVGTGGVALYQPPGGLSQSPYSTILGRPVVPSEYSQTIGDEGDLMLLSFREYQAIEKGGTQSASSIHVRFVYDETVFRFVYRVDGISKWNAPLTPFNGGPTQSPFITLAAR
jgi:HK97 family phage major capsid protein